MTYAILQSGVVGGITAAIIVFGVLVSQTTTTPIECPGLVNVIPIGFFLLLLKANEIMIFIFEYEDNPNALVSLATVVFRIQATLLGVLLVVLVNVLWPVGYLGKRSADLMFVCLQQLIFLRTTQLLDRHLSKTIVETTLYTRDVFQSYLKVQIYCNDKCQRC